MKNAEQSVRNIITGHRRKYSVLMPTTGPNRSFAFRAIFTGTKQFLIFILPKHSQSSRPMSNEYIPRATADKLAEHHPKGTRHQAALDIAVSLIGNGLPAAGVFATLRSKFEEDVTDKELHDVVHWASNQGIPLIE